MKRIVKFTNMMILLSLMATSCSSPGVNLPQNSFFGGSPIFTNAYSDTIRVIEINKQFLSASKEYEYMIAKGDILSLIVWGQEEAFPMNGASGGLNSPIFARIVDNNGEIFVPYIENVKVSGLSIPNARNEIKKRLSTQFVNPQVDINIQVPSNYNKVYIQGEINRPIEIPLGISELDLGSALYQANGMNLVTANASKVFIIRDYGNEPEILFINLKNINSIALAKKVTLFPGDIVFVSTSSLTKWNRFLSQIFPFATFINQVDQIDARD